MSLPYLITITASTIHSTSVACRGLSRRIKSVGSASLGYKEGDFPNAEKASAEVMALPVYPELTDEMKDFVVETILTFLS